MTTSPMSDDRNSCHKALLIVSLLVLGGCASSAAVLPPPAPFTPVSADFAHVWKKGTHPFTGAAVRRRGRTA
ncbi:MAG: hypothetical protein HP496_02275 [Nitrospira sp.]|nr:hypothetical protein [Nitrospira sp.]